MTIEESIELFAAEMINEINHSNIDGASKESLIQSVHDVAATVSSTAKAEK